MAKIFKKGFSVLLTAVMLFSTLTVIADLGVIKTHAASWNGYNYGGGEVEGYQTILDAYGIDYDVYMKWLDDHDADSKNPYYYLGTPYEEYDHRNPYGDCSGAYGDYDEPGVAAMNCTGFVWHVLYKAAVHSGASAAQIDELGVMGGVLSSWYSNGVYRIFFDDLDDAYDSGVLEKGDVMWIYGDDDNHNAIFYGDDPHDWMYWDSAGDENRYCEVHAIGDCLGVYVCKVTQPDYIELHINTSKGDSSCFGAKYCVFTSQSAAQAAINNPNNDSLWDKRVGTITLDNTGHGVLRNQSAPSKSQLWVNGKAQTQLSYFNSSAKKVNAANTYYAVQWSSTDGIMDDTTVHVLKDSGNRTPGGYKIYSFNAPRRVATPAFTTAKSTFSGVSLKWNAVKGAEKYRIYYKNAQGAWTRMAETTSTSYLDTDVRSGKSYTYTIRCVDKYGNFTSSFNNKGWRVTHKILSTPSVSSYVSEANGLRLKWKAVDGAEKYIVYYKNSNNNWTRVGVTSNTEILHGKIEAGKSYLYTIRCADKDGDFTSDYNKSGWKATYKNISAPSITELTAEPTGIRLKWNAVNGASKYRLYHKLSSGGWERIGEASGTEFLDEQVTAGNSYTYTIRCLNSSGYVNSGFNSTGWSQKFTGIATPKITSTSNETGGVRIKWTPVENAYKYRVYYKNSKGNWVKMAETSASEYLDSDVTPGTAYTYTVRCVNSKGGFISDFDRTGVKHTYLAATPEINKSENLASGIKLSWNKISGVAGYRLFYYGQKGWTKLADVTGTSYTDKDVKSGTIYRYTVRCIDKNGSYVSGYNSAGFKATFISTPEISSATVTNDGIALKWNAVKGAQGYRVFRYGTNDWKRIADTTEPNFTDTDVNSGIAYRYTVRCIDKDGKYISSFISAGTKATFVSTPQLTKLNCNNDGVSLVWGSIKGASSYRVFRKSGDDWARLGDVSGTSYTDKAAKDGVSYTYTVRCMDKNKSYISDFDHAGFTVKYIKSLVFDISNADDGVTVSWSDIEGAVSYRVYKKIEGSTWKTAANIKGNSWLDTKVEIGSTYSYFVRGLNEKGNFVTGYLPAGKQIIYTKPEMPSEADNEQQSPDSEPNENSSEPN